MANVVYACWRRFEDAVGGARLGEAARRISPAWLPAPPPRVVQGLREACCLTGPVGAARMKGTSARLGAFLGASTDWDRPGAPVPDGSFLVVRSGADKVEVCTDASASRTLWYVMDDRRFLASTSPRALVALLGSFELNRAAVVWMLSSGYLGPSAGWDARLRRVPPDARLVLDRSTWRLRLDASPVELKPRAMGHRECARELAALIRETVRDFDFSGARWVLPLSGGADSRSILVSLLEAGHRPRTVTWGRAASLHEPGNDAFIARRVAGHFGLHHDYLALDDPDLGPEEVLDRFLEACGGSNDQIYTYLDGFRTWATLAGQGVDGIIRGDEGFGGRHVRSHLQARTACGLVVLSDFLPRDLAEQVADGHQVLPDALLPRDGESPVAYRTRLYHAYRLPSNLAPLSDIKAPFVEIANPLLARRLLAHVREWPDDLGRDRSAYLAAVRSMLPAFPFATMAAGDDQGDFLWSPAWTKFLRDELGSAAASRLYPKSYLDHLLGILQAGRPRLELSRGLRAAIKRVVPVGWIRKVRAWTGGPDEMVPRGVQVLRAVLALRAVRMLEADAAHLAGLPPVQAEARRWEFPLEHALRFGSRVG